MSQFWALQQGAEPKEILEGLLDVLTVADHMGDVREAGSKAAVLAGIDDPFAEAENDDDLEPLGLAGNLDGEDEEEDDGEEDDEDEEPMEDDEW